MNNDQMRELLKSYNNSDLTSLMEYKGNKKKFNNYMDLMALQKELPMSDVVPSNAIINIKSEFNIPTEQFKTWITNPYYRNEGDLNYLAVLYYLSIDTNRIFEMRKKHSKYTGKKYEAVGDMPLMYNTLLLEYIAQNDDLSKLTTKEFYLTSNILNAYKSDSRTDYLSQQTKMHKYKLIKPEGATKFVKTTIFDTVIYNRFSFKDNPKNSATQMANIVSGFAINWTNSSDFMISSLVKTTSENKLKLELKLLKSALNPLLTLENTLSIGSIGDTILAENFSIYIKRSVISTLVVLMHFHLYRHEGYEEAINNSMEIFCLSDADLSPLQLHHFVISHKKGEYIPPSAYSRRFDTLGAMSEFIHKDTKELYS